MLIDWQHPERPTNEMLRQVGLVRHANPKPGRMAGSKLVTIKEVP